MSKSGLPLMTLMLRVSTAGRPSRQATTGVLCTTRQEAHPPSVSELWTSAAAHGRSLRLDSVQAAIAEARPLLSGDMGGFRFEVLGSPLRD